MKNKGFTLVELLAVIAILAILVIIAIPNVLKMFNDSKKNAFMVQARKTANVAQEHIVLSSDKTFDCNSLLTGQKFKDCTATVDKNNQVSVDVLGSGAYENFLMVDVTPNANSGTFVDLSKLNTIETEKEFKESLVKNNKINEPTFKIMSGKEVVDLALKINAGETSTEDEINTAITEYDNNISKLTFSNNKLINSSDVSDMPVYIEFDISKEMLGKYKLTMKMNSYDISSLPMFSDSLIEDGINKSEEDYIDFMFESVSVDRANSIRTFIIDVKKPEKYYFLGNLYTNDGGVGPEITLESVSNFSLNGGENVVLLPSDVSSYKDAGVSFKGKNLTGNDVYTYTNLKDKEGEYKQNYIIKTNRGIKILRRYISVVGKTSEKCFKFNKDNQEIEQYYFVENNVSGGKKCPMNVVIPEKISAVQVKSIGHEAFTYSDCGNSILKTSSNNKYEIKNIDCSNEMRPIGITSIILPEGLEYIYASAFDGNNLKTVTIPSTVKAIDRYAFRNNKLQSVIFKGNKSKIHICKAFHGLEHSDSVNAIEGTSCAQ